MTLDRENAHEHDPTRQRQQRPADGSRRDILVGIARGALAGAAVAIGSDAAAQPSPAPLPRVTEAVTPFRVVTSSAAISDARRRLQATRWPERQTADDWQQGAPLAGIQVEATAVTRHVRLVGWPAGAEEEPVSIGNQASSLYK